MKVLSSQVTYPLDVLRLRLAVDPATKSMSQVSMSLTPYLYCYFWLKMFVAHQICTFSLILAMMCNFARSCDTVLLTGRSHSHICQVAVMMLRDEGVKSFYKGLGPSLLGIAPYIALNFCVFDL